MVNRTHQKLTMCLVVGIGLVLVSNTAFALEFIPGKQFYNEDWTTVIKTDTESSLNKVSDVIAINGTGDSIITGAYYENSTMMFYLARTNATGGFRWFQNLVAENISVVRQIAIDISRKEIYVPFYISTGSTTYDTLFQIYDLETGAFKSEYILKPGFDIFEVRIMAHPDLSPYVYILMMGFQNDPFLKEMELFVFNSENNTIHAQHKWAFEQTYAHLFDFEYSEAGGEIYIPLNWGPGSATFDQVIIYQINPDTGNVTTTWDLTIGPTSYYVCATDFDNDSFYFIMRNSTSFYTGELFLLVKEVNSEPSLIMTFLDSLYFSVGNLKVVDEGDKFFTSGWSTTAWMGENETIVFGRYYWNRYDLNSEGDAYSLIAHQPLYDGDLSSSIFAFDADESEGTLYICGKTNIETPTGSDGYVSQYTWDLSRRDFGVFDDSDDGFSFEDLWQQVVDSGNWVLMGSTGGIGLLVGLLLSLIGKGKGKGKK